MRKPEMASLRDTALERNIAEIYHSAMARREWGCVSLMRCADLVECRFPALAQSEAIRVAIDIVKGIRGG
jgi:hypothetical protein